MISGSIAVVGMGFLGAALLPEDLARKSAYLALGTAPIAVVAIASYGAAGQALRRLPDRPQACQNCENYIGQTFVGEKGANQFICAMHPFGTEFDVCNDNSWEKTPVEPVEYRLIRLQGVGFPNLWFARCEPGDGLSEIIQEAIPVSQCECDRLKARYRLKSGTGLPGCIFKSSASTTAAAFEELMDSCFD
jgi:hypothetical protein